MPSKGADRSWVATIRCSCGWTGEVADHPDEVSATVGARAMWILHCYDVPTPAHAGQPAAFTPPALVAVEALADTGA